MPKDRFIYKGMDGILCSDCVEILAAQRASGRRMVGECGECFAFGRVGRNEQVLQKD